MLITAGGGGLVFLSGDNHESGMAPGNIKLGNLYEL